MTTLLNILWLGMQELRSLVERNVMMIAFVAYAFTLAIYVPGDGYFERGQQRLRSHLWTRTIRPCPRNSSTPSIRHVFKYSDDLPPPTA